TALCFGRVRARYTRPPEDRFEKHGVFLLLNQRRSGYVEKQIWVPSPDLAGPGIVGIPKVGGDDRDRRIPPCNAVQQRDPEPVYTYVFRDFRMGPVHDSCME